MKKITWIIALLAALALIVTGCPNEGDPNTVTVGGDGDGTAENWYLATDDEGTKAPNNRLTLHGTDDPDGRTYIRIFFDPHDADFEKIKIDFTISDNGGNVCWQSVKDSTGTWGFNGAGLPDGNYIGWYENGPIEIDPATRFSSSWGATGSALQKSSMFFVCIYVTGVTSDTAVFTLTGVSFTGVGSGEGEGEGEGGGDEGLQPDPSFTADNTKSLSDVVKVGTGAAIVSSDLVKLGTKGGATVIQVAPNATNEFHLTISFNNQTLDISEATKVVVSWISGSVTSANFNVMLTMKNYTPSGGINSNRSALQNSASNTNGEFVFATHHPDNWGGWEGPAISETDGVCSEIEIFSEDSALSDAYIYFTKIDIQ